MKSPQHCQTLKDVLLKSYRSLFVKSITFLYFPTTASKFLLAHSNSINNTEGANAASLPLKLARTLPVTEPHFILAMEA